jgi:ligand-binding sensor domain-containing protein/serine phosphatase RsbU (regulator of sigma subunit)
VSKRFIFFVLIFVFFTTGVSAQVYPFVNYNAENGLSQSQVISVFQNTDGQMWFGTNGGGITLFDGHSYEYITTKEGLADNVVFCIVKDSKGRILIGTYNGLSVYENNKIKNYTTSNGLSDNRIFTILLDKNNTAILGTAKGVSTFKDTVCGAMKIDKNLDSSSVFHILNDSKQHFWYSTLGKGVFYNNGSLIKNYSYKNGLKNDMVFSVMEKTPNIFWLFSGEGLCELTQNVSDEIKQINPANINKAATYYSYLKKTNGDIWISTSNGVIKIEKNGNTKVFKIENGLTDNSIWKIFSDRENNMWFISDQNGISKLAGERFNIYNTSSGYLSDNVKAVFQNKDGDYFLGFQKGLSILKNNEISNYNNIQLNGSADIWAITEDKTGNILIGTANGLIVYNGKTYKRVICKNNDDHANIIFDVFVDSKNEIWLGTQVGVAKVVDGYIQALKEVSITKNYVNKIFQDKNDHFWFCTAEGLFKYNNLKVEHFTEKNNFTQKSVSGIVADTENNLWLATSEGLYKYDGKNFTKFKDKPYNTDSEITSIIIDKNNTIWLGLINGLDRITNNNGKFKTTHYDVDDGFLGQECNQNSILLNNKDELVLGTSKGMIVYEERFDKENLLEPVTKIKSVDLFFQKTDWKLYADSVSNENIPLNPQLSYNKNYLTFNFIGVSLSTPKKVTYEFMLKGLDENWRSTNKNEISYSNIPPGTYEFLLKANNGENVWNKEPIVFKFKISPPFWRTWWFYSIIAIIISIGIYSYLKIRAANKKILKQNVIIEQKNGEIQIAYKEIEEKNQNITDSINYAKRIQQSFITSEKIINNTISENFILFKPRDIVSGDFYLAYDLPDRAIVVCADCTGHGIPGAFMSLIGISLLNEISRLNIILNTSQILEELRERIIKALNPERSESGGKDGMDISIISILKNKEQDAVTVYFSGANSSIYLTSSTNKNFNMQEFKGDKQPVGFHSNMQPFTQQTIKAQSGDIIYLFTDGYADQFGGKNGKKFMSKQLRHEIGNIYSLPMNQQKLHLISALVGWQGNLEQVDDVTIIGIKL